MSLITQLLGNTVRSLQITEEFMVFFRYNLGKVLEALGEYEKAGNAMATALMEERNNPILPFNSVPLCFE